MQEIDAVVFDMDGLLIDTEPIWRRVEIEIFGRLGLHLTEEQCLQTMGVRVAEVVSLWYRRHPWTGPSIERVTDHIVAGVIAQVRAEGVPMRGVFQALDTVYRAGLPIAIASSSSEKLIRAVVERLGIERYVEAICSADGEPEGKPHPGVYLRAARVLDVAPERCLAFEDSPNGVQAARAAGMFCIVVPDPHLAGDSRLSAANMRLDTLETFTPELLAKLGGERQYAEEGKYGSSDRQDGRRSGQLFGERETGRLGGHSDRIPG